MHYIFWTCEHSVNCVWWYIIISLVKRLFCCVQGQGDRKSSELHWMVIQDDIFWTVLSFVAKLSVKHHHEPECLVKRLFCCHCGQDYSDGTCNKNVIVSTVSFYSIFRAVDHFAARLSLMVYHLMLEHLVKRLDCCGQSHGDGRHMNCLLTFHGE